MHTTSIKPLKFTLFTMALLFMSMITGCQNSDNPVNPDNRTTVVDDAAESVANALATNHGGTFDQMNDIMIISSVAGLQNEAGAISDIHADDSSIHSVSKTYDPVTGWWTLTLSRQRFDDFGYAEMHREYQYQFLNSNGNFQQYWLTGSDTAHSLHFKIISGSGERHTMRFAHHLVSLSSEWMVTGINTNIITINTVNNGAYTRVGSDTMKTLNALRTLNHTLTMTFNNVTGPRTTRLHLAEKTSGTITGTYHADITFTRGELYTEKTIDKTFTITFGGDGTTHLYMGGRRFMVDPVLGRIIR